jgi:hypothetical protein
MNIKHTIEITKDEDILGVIHKSVIVYWWKWIFAIGILLAPFIFFFPLIALGPIGFIAFLGALMLSVTNAIRLWSVMRGTMFVITNKRLIDIEYFGFLKRERNEMEFREIEEVILPKVSIVKRVLGLGSIRMNTLDHEEYDMEFTGIRQTKKIKEMILEIKYVLEGGDSGDGMHERK